MVEFDDLPEDVFETAAGTGRRVVETREKDLRQLADSDGTNPRSEAIERGRRLGAHEASQRGETGQEANLRIQRAMAYAAWEYDGRPPDTSSYRKEFKSSLPTDLAPHLQKPGPDGKPGKKS